MERKREFYYGTGSGEGRSAGEVCTQWEGQGRTPDGAQGELYPTTTHQRILGCLFTEIAVYLRAREDESRVISSPFAVFLTEEGRCCAPDLAVICDEEKLDEEGCHGAPDWVVEVVSSASRKEDYGGKLGDYIHAGVREYWIVDPEKKVITAYDLEEPDVPEIHPFGDIIKSCIYHDLLIDSSQLDRIRYRKAAPRVRAGENVVSSLVSAVKRALGEERASGEVPEGLVEQVVARELGTRGSQGAAGAPGARSLGDGGESGVCSQGDIMELGVWGSPGESKDPRARSLGDAGEPGARGSQGDAGEPGARGSQGDARDPGMSSLGAVGEPGARSLGDAGESGGRGNLGTAGEPGLRESQETAGEQEYPGKSGSASAAEVRAYIEDNFAELTAAGNRGKLMKAVMNTLKGRADTRVVSEVVAQLCK